MKHFTTLLAALLLVPVAAQCAHPTKPDPDTKTLRVFIFAGQSNMVGSDSKSQDIKRFPPFAGLDMPQDKVLFSYNIGREDKLTSQGWLALQPVDGVVGPELSFARRVSQEIKAPIAIIKCAAGGTTLGGDWNPDEPKDFKLYPLALQLIQSSLAELDRRKVAYRIEGFMWHQGENDMFDKEFKPNYGNNLKNFLAKWRRDLKTPNLKFYIGELCTKTIWGMDNRENMYAIRAAQKSVTESDPLAQYIPTSHDAVEIGGGEGLHYHYGTLGQLEHGVNYADAYLRTIGKKSSTDCPLKVWPYEKGSTVKLFVLAGHRNMEGERAFTQELRALKGQESLANDNGKIAFKYSIGGGYKTSNGWEPLGPAGYYDTFGPELSFGKTLQGKVSGNVAVAKFTHSGSQMNDWTPQGTDAKDLNLYPQFIAFIKESIKELQVKGHQVELAGIFYHVGENEMSFGPYRRNAAKWLQSTVAKSRQDLALPSLKWYVSQQPPRALFSWANCLPKATLNATSQCRIQSRISPARRPGSLPAAWPLPLNSRIPRMMLYEAREPTYKDHHECTSGLDPLKYIYLSDDCGAFLSIGRGRQRIWKKANSRSNSGRDSSCSAEGWQMRVGE